MILARVLLRDAIGAGAVRRLEGLDGEAHLLAERAGDEAAHRMGHPAGYGHDLLQRGAFGTAQQLQHDGLLAALARCGCAVLGLGGLPRTPGLRRNAGRLWRGAASRRWIAFQRRATAVLRSVNFLTGFRSSKGATPAKLFHTWTSRSAGQLAASFASSFSLAKCSWPSGICPAAGKAVMLLSASMANSLMVRLLLSFRTSCRQVDRRR